MRNSVLTYSAVGGWAAMRYPVRARTGSVEGKAQALQAALLATLEAMARRAAPEGLTHEAERLLHLMDESHHSG
jgi:hypothetical protein